MDPECSRADVLKAEILNWRSGNAPELAESSGFGGILELDLRTSHHFGFVDLHIAVEELLLAKVLQALGFDESGPAAHGAVTEGVAFVRAAGLMGAQTKLLPA